MTADEFDRHLGKARRALLGAAYRITKNWDDAEDVVQDASAYAWERARSGEKFANLAGLLYRATCYRAMQRVWLEKTKKYASVPLEEWSEGAITSPDEDPCSLALRQCERELCRAYVAALSKQCRLTDKQHRRLMGYYSGATQGQIAANEGVSPQSVHSGINSALLAMRRAANQSGKGVMG